MITTAIYRSLLISLIISGFHLTSCKEEPIDSDEESSHACRLGPDSQYASCTIKPDTTLLDIATWNIQDFPQHSSTGDAVKEIIRNFHADIIAVQEITDTEAFLDLAEELEDWEAQVITSTSLNLGFIYNTCEIKTVSDIKEIDIGDPYSFPRKPVEMSFTHNNGLEVILINVHLKCCNDGDERRIAASNLLKDYIDSTYPDENIVFLGDFNDEIDDNTSPFSNFIEDRNNYIFTDMDLAKSSVSNYSYPSYPSHIDHIVVSNELFNHIGSTNTIRFSTCVDDYATTVSDHRPVILSLLPEE